MRNLVVAAALAVCACSSTPTPAASDAGAEVVDASPMCPAALGTPAARTVMPTAGPMDSVLRLNHIQLKGTHNSYHLRPTAPVPDWDYAHAPLNTQLQEQGVRGLELDIHWNAACGRWEVYHLPIIDALSTCRWFTDCLQTVRTWSDAHPSHHTLFLHIEPKDAIAAADLDARIASFEREVHAVFSDDLLVRPDDVRGSSPTLAEALRTRGWPTLGATRGRVLFYFDDSGAFRTAYTHNNADLNGRVAFVDSAPTDPFAGIAIINNPTRTAEINAALAARMIVRLTGWTATDHELMTPQDPRQLLPVGGHINSTDFPASAPGVTNWMSIPGGTPSRCNPLTAPTGCTSAAIESL